jgi:hypothetical protein
MIEPVHHPVMETKTLSSQSKCQVCPVIKRISLQLISVAAVESTAPPNMPKQ